MEIINQDVTFKCSDGMEMVAYLSRPKSSGPQPAIIVIHEAWGLNEQIKGIARRFAGQDFVAIAPHLFTRDADLLTEKNVESAMVPMWAVSPEKRNDPRAIEALMKNMSEIDRKVMNFFFPGKEAFQRTMIDDLLSCKDYLRSLDFVRWDKLGVTGFCLGGGLSYQVSTVYPFNATVPFYGANPTPIESVAKIRGPVLAIYAGEDQGINSGVPELVGAMIKYKKEFELKVYKGAQHSFFNETRPRYDKAASADAWESTIWFLNKNLRR
jgi:carboxymethylenebutenolidase